jgi:hypothetical protein
MAKIKERHSKESILNLGSWLMDIRMVVGNVLKIRRFSEMNISDSATAKGEIVGKVPCHWRTTEERKTAGGLIVLALAVLQLNLLVRPRRSLAYGFQRLSGKR